MKYSYCIPLEEYINHFILNFVFIYIFCLITCIKLKSILMKNLTIMSIDPGVNNCGVSILDFIDDQPHITFASTIFSKKCLKQFDYIENIYDLQYAKLLITVERLKRIFKLYNPDIVVSEAAFFNTKKPSAAMPGMELIGTIRYMIQQESNSTVPFYTIDPSTIKQFMGVPGNSGDKNLMKTALVNKNLSYDEVPPILLDEHSVDAVCIGLCQKFILDKAYT